MEVDPAGGGAGPHAPPATATTEYFCSAAAGRASSRTAPEGAVVIERIVDFSATTSSWCSRPWRSPLSPGSGRCAHAARRDPRPLRHPGDRLLALGPFARRDRGPGHLSDRRGHARRSPRARGPRLLRLRLLVRVRHLRGRHRPLLGPHPHARVPLDGAAVAARGRQDRAGSRRARPGLGLPVRARGRVREAQPRRPALVPGLVPALLPEGRPRRRRGGRRRRVREAVPGQRRSEPACAPTGYRSRRWSKRCAEATPRSAGG